MGTIYKNGIKYGGGSGLPEPEAKDKLLLSTENTETSKLEWSQVDKYKAVEIPLYESKAAAEADIANLSDGQIIGTKDEGNENAKPVDVVEKGNMHAVTSNAVAEAVSDRVYKVKNMFSGAVSPNFDYMDFDLSLLENKICNVMIIGNASKVYLGKFNVSKYNDNYNIVLYYGPNLTVSIVGNNVRVACSDGCYMGYMTYIDWTDRERILQ